MSFLDKTGLSRLWVNILALSETKVSTSRTINGKSLLEDINLSASDVGASEINHNHNDIYYTETEVDEKISDTYTYTDTKTANLASTSIVDTKINTHNTSTSAHTDIRNSITELTTSKADKAHTHAISDVTNLQSTLNAKLPNTTTYAGSDTIGGAATSAKKISITRVTSAITDIAANIPTNTEAIYFCGSDGLTYGCPKTYCIINIKKGDNHRTIMDCYHLNTGDHYINGCMDTRDTTANPWTGWKLQPNDTTINTINNAISNLQTISNTHETKTDATAKLNEAKSYTDTKVSGLTTRLNTLADSDDTTLDQLSEIVTYIKSNKSLIDSVTTSKADKEHTHYTSEIYDDNDYEVLKGNALDSIINSIDVELFNMAYTVTNVNNSMQNKVNVSDIIDNLTTNVSNKPLSAAQGVIIKGSIDDLQAGLDGHVADTTAHMTSVQKSNLTTAYNHSQTAHAPSNAQPNQNAFSNIVVSGQSTVVADTTTDTITFNGSNVSITTDATNDKITFSVADGTTSAKGVVQLTNSTSSTSTTTAATPNSVKSAYDLANTAKTNAATAQSKADSAYNLADSKVDSLLDLGITVTADELNYVDGVTSGIQSQLDGKAASSHNHTITASASDDDVVVLTGTNGTNKVTYSASHADSGVTAGTYRSVTVDAKGHVTDGTNPTSLSGYGITDAYTKTQVDNIASGKANSSHGNHVPATQTASNKVFLRNDNTWATVTPANIGAAASSHTHTVANISDLTATATELNYMDGVTSNVQAQLDSKAASSHTHNYAGSSSVGGAATSANKLNTNAGSATQPIYFANGVPVKTTYTLEKSVPSNAVFTDTDTKVTNTLATTTKAYVTGTTSAITNTGTQVFDTGVYLDTTAGKLVATTFSGTTFSGDGVATVAEVKSYLGIS